MSAHRCCVTRVLPSGWRGKCPARIRSDAGHCALSILSPSRFSILSALALLSAAHSQGASLKQAEFTRVINDVRVMPIQQQPAAAKVGDKISGQTGVSTGVASRAELQFPDKTLTRIGANTVFRLDRADRTVDLEKGVMLLQVPKQIGGARVRAAAFTAAVTGTTVMFEYEPGGTVKIIVLEGEVDVYLNDDPREVRTLVAGDLLVMKSDAKVIPLPVKVDLALLRKTSRLVNSEDFRPLGNQRHLEGALTDQRRLMSKGELLKSAFEIKGRGTQVTLTNEARQEVFKNIVLAGRDRGGRAVDGELRGFGGGVLGGSAGNLYAQALGRTGGSQSAGGSSGSGGGGSSGGSGSSSGGYSGGSYSVGAVAMTSWGGFGTSTTVLLGAPGTTVFGTGSSITTNPHATAYNSVVNAVTTMQGVTYNPLADGSFGTFLLGAPTSNPLFTSEFDAYAAGRGTWFAFKSDSLYISGNTAVDTASGPRNIALASVGSATLSSVTPYAGVATDAVWTLPSSVDSVIIASGNGSVTMQPDFAIQGSGGLQDLVFYSRYADVVINGLTATGPFSGIHVPFGSFLASAGQDVITNSAVIEARDIKMRAGRDVRIDASSKLMAKTLMQIEAGGRIQIQNSSQLAALAGLDPLSVLLTAQGNVELTNATINATNVEMTSGTAGAVTPGSTGGISIVNSTIAADVIKGRVVTESGQLLVSSSILGRDTPAAGSLIRLYGEGTAGVRFTGDSTLNATSVDIAGKTVTIDTGGKVRLSHPANARVHADTANFNNGTHGNFTTKAGAPVTVTTGPYGSRPAY
ncbi:MAG: FecR family protein [Verrucomicrobiaceae bacterium]|nr:FecR family protein [Verrucomicrobiaceae bacterium]